MLITRRVALAGVALAAAALSPACGGSSATGIDALMGRDEVESPGRTTLYLTAQTSLYRVRLRVPGLP